MEIKVLYQAVDGYRKARTFKDIGKARKFAQEYVGLHPEIGCGYAIAGDGVGKIMVQGTTLKALFAFEEK